MRREWSQIKLEKPRLLIGWRSIGRQLRAHRVPLHEDVFEELSAMCQPAIDRLHSYDERPYEPFAALDDEQYFWQPHSELPSRAEAVESDDEPEMSDLVHLVQNVDGLDAVTRDDINEGGYSFYGICWPHLDGMIGFVSRTNPSSSLRPGYRFFRYGNQMRHVDKPDFLLQDGSDLVVGHEGTAILSPYSFAILLGDVGVDFTRVEDDVQATKRRLARKIGLTATAEASLKSEGLRTRRTAKRLRYLPERIGGLSLDPDLVRNQLAVHGIDPSRVLDDENKFRFTPRDVETFLDLVEGRFFEADFGGERRRADRFSSR